MANRKRFSAIATFSRRFLFVNRWVDLQRVACISASAASRLVYIQATRCCQMPKIKVKAVVNLPIKSLRNGNRFTFFRKCYKNKKAKGIIRAIGAFFVFGDKLIRTDKINYL